MQKKSNYIEYGGDITVQPPFQLNRPSMYCFWFQSDCNKLQKILDTRLNFTGNGKRYVPFTPSIMIIFADAPHAYSASDQSQGYITMNESVFWILTVEQEKVDGEWKNKRLVWFIPYIFVDNPVELVAGREVAGFPKALAEIIIPKNHHHANSFAINVPSYAKFGANTEFMVNRLLSIENQTPETDFKTDFKNIDKAKGKIKSFLASFKTVGFGTCNNVITDTGGTFKLFENFTSNMLSTQMPAVFLKQFRSASNDGKACYQAIVESAFSINGFHGASVLKASNYTLNINHLDSFPVAKELGLSTGQKPTRVVWMSMSFSNTSGKEIWVSQ
jgi:hypothetical protein